MKKLFYLLCILIFLTGCNSTIETSSIENAYILNSQDSITTLYENAKNEDILTIYSVSSRLIDVATSYQKEYPGIYVQIIDLTLDELHKKIQTELASGALQCDLIFCTDTDGFISEELIKNSIISSYIPEDINCNLNPIFTVCGTPVVVEAIGISYNPSYYNTCPINNWWELIETPWYQKVCMPNVTRNVTGFSVAMMIFENEALLEKSYKEYYHKEYISDLNESISQFYLKSLVNNGLIVVNSSDEVAEWVGSPGSNSDIIGIMPSSKLRLSTIGYDLAIEYEITPFPPLLYLGNIMMVNDCPNRNNAQLFIRWILGESDGNGIGSTPFRQEGAWSPRLDVESVIPFPLDDISLRIAGGAYSYIHKDELITYWRYLFK